MKIPEELEIVGAKVSILPGFDEVYMLAYAGSLGTVKDFKLDEYGYPRIWVEWDREDWRYNGEADQWTYPEHFEIIEQPPTIEEIARDVAERAAQHTCPNCSKEYEEDADYIDMIIDAFDEAAASEGFILVAINRESEGPGDEELVPMITTASWSEEAAQMLNVTLSQISRIVRVKGMGKGGRHL